DQPLGLAGLLVAVRAGEPRRCVVSPRPHDDPFGPDLACVTLGFVGEARPEPAGSVLRDDGNSEPADTWLGRLDHESARRPPDDCPLRLGAPPGAARRSGRHIPAVPVALDGEDDLRLDLREDADAALDVLVARSPDHRGRIARSTPRGARHTIATMSV